MQELFHQLEKQFQLKRRQKIDIEIITIREICMLVGFGKKEPNCPYGNLAKFVCVNSQCKKPGLICQKGQNSQSQCWLFHQNCQKIRWIQVQIFAKDNNVIKSPQFINMQEKIENVFLRALQKIQTEHQKFKIWTKTYGHSLQTMKFIKVLIDKNYEQLTGDYMAGMLPVITNKQPKRIQIPMIIQPQIQSIKGEIDRAIEKVSSLYLRSKKIQKPFIYSNFNNQNSDNFHSYSQSPSSYSNLSNNSQNLHSTQKDVSKDYSATSVSAQCLNNSPHEFKSKILESLSPIESYFEGRIIKSAKLIYRASQHNFSIKKFHQSCDNISDTLTLVHNQYGKKFGGYTPVAWTSDKKHWVADKSLRSFIFSVDMGEKFKLNLAQFAIASNPQRGPTFGCCDICIVDNSNKQKSNCEFPISYNMNGKYVRSQNTSTLFTGNPKGQFYVKQWQVFQLQFEQK